MDGNSDAAKWSIQFRDLPEVVQKRPVTSRLVADVPIVDSDPITAMAGLGYRFVPKSARLAECLPPRLK